MKCRRCPADADPGRTLCAFHRTLAVVEAEARATARAQARVCISCPATARVGRLRCAHCAALQAAAEARRGPRARIPGACSKCNGPRTLGDGRLCALCRTRIGETQKAKRLERIAAGLCARCDTPAAEGVKVCQYHRDLQALKQAVRKAEKKARQTSQK